MINAESIINQLKFAIKYDSLVLPTLPEVAIKVKETANNPNASVSSITKVIEVDPAISARLLKVANSPTYRSSKATDDLKSAINRLGIPTTARLVTSLAMAQMFQSNSKFIDTTIRKIWDQATEVAGNAHVFCKNYTNLQPDQAALAGLIHNIGALPILTFAEQNEDLIEHPEFIDTLIAKVGPKLGEMILSQWQFSKELREAPKVLTLVTSQSPHHKPTYTDILIAAKIKSLAGTSHPYASLPWSEVPAFAKLGIDTSEDTNEVEDLSLEMEAATALLR